MSWEVWDPQEGCKPQCELPKSTTGRVLAPGSAVEALACSWLVFSTMVGKSNSPIPSLIKPLPLYKGGGGVVLTLKVLLRITPHAEIHLRLGLVSVLKGTVEFGVCSCSGEPYIF